MVSGHLLLSEIMGMQVKALWLRWEFRIGGFRLWVLHIAAWLRGVSKCHKYELKKFHCDYIRVSKGASRTYQKSCRRVEKWYSV